MRVKQANIITQMIGLIIYFLLTPISVIAEEKKFKWLEPYPIKKAELETLIRSRTNWFTTGRYVNKGGLGVKLN